MAEMKIFLQSVLILAAVLNFPTRAEGTAEVVYVRVGDTAILRPPAGAILPKSYLYWYFGNENGPLLGWRNPLGGHGNFDPKKSNIEADHWSTELSLSDNSLIIKNIRQENFGTIVFISESKAIFKLVKLIVTVAPTPVLVPGESLTLTCATESPPNPNIHWMSPQLKKFNQGILERTVTGRDSGNWTCVVTNNKKESKVNIPVTVVDFSPGHPQSYTSESSPLTIPFSIPAGISWNQIKSVDVKEVNLTFYPKLASNVISKNPQRLFYLSPNVSMTWKEDQGRKLSPVFNQQKNAFSLTRRLGKDDDRGDYVCSMTAREGKTLKTTVRVEVLQITASPGPELVSGQQVNLTCSLGVPLPHNVTLKWIPPEKSSLQKPDHHHAKITILEVGARDEGEWRCELLQGDTRLTSAEITLKIESKLSVWMLVITCSVTVIVLLLLLLVFILCRRRHRKTSHPRHRLCKCKNPKPKGFYRT